MLYHDLMQFKNESKFHQYGFGVCCKYHKWLKKVEDLKENPNEEQLVFQVGINATDLHLLGLEYMKSKGQETDHTVFMNQKFNKALANY